MQATLHRAALHYGGGMVLHTAASGSVGHLDALYLHLLDDGVSAAGEVRINIAYLNGYAASALIDEARATLARIDWRRDARALLDDAPTLFAANSAPIRTLFDCALHDLLAKQRGISVAALLGAQADGAPAYRSNQTLFWSSDEVMLARAALYLERGFDELKLRVGIGEFSDDLRRLDLLRSHFGSRAVLSVDANGTWQPQDCEARLAALAMRGVEYVEQPLAAGDWHSLREVARNSPLTLMLDESLQSPADIDTLCGLAGLPVAAHLKLVKLGGIAATVAAGHQLMASGIPLMIGQMNEGAAATAAALQVCCALAPRWAELYGADGLSDDPANGVGYGDGMARVMDAHGLGVDFDAARTELIS